MSAEKDEIEKLFHQIWGQAHDHVYVKEEWCKFQLLLDNYRKTIPSVEELESLREAIAIIIHTMKQIQKEI